MARKNVNNPGSFRDPAGQIYQDGDRLLRKINPIYIETYKKLMSSGLYSALVNNGLLVRHKEIAKAPDKIIIQPQMIPFISYPYEWAFSQLKDAALLTLKIQKIALVHNMVLKDASAYNVQFWQGLPIFIDTLSFEPYVVDLPWRAYGQFCRHFLAPLLLMRYVDLGLNDLLKNHLDGIPLDLASSLLPGSSWLDGFCLLHIHLQAKLLTGKDSGQTKQYKIKKVYLITFIDSLIAGIEKLQPKNTETVWSDYSVANPSYTQEALKHKEKIVKELLGGLSSMLVWDIGANDGCFSKIAAKNSFTVAVDKDPVTIERLYVSGKKNKQKNILPLIMDVANPTSNLGWANQERLSFFDRGLPDTIIMLAFIHHLVIFNNVPLGKVAEFLKTITRNLIIEFPTENDHQVKTLFSQKDHHEYSVQLFERIFKIYFRVIRKIRVRGSERIIYLMARK